MKWHAIRRLSAAAARAGAHTGHGTPNAPPVAEISHTQNTKSDTRHTVFKTGNKPRTLVRQAGRRCATAPTSLALVAKTHRKNKRHCGRATASLHAPTRRCPKILTHTKCTHKSTHTEKASRPAALLGVIPISVVVPRLLPSSLRVSRAASFTGGMRRHRQATHTFSRTTTTTKISHRILLLLPSRRPPFLPYRASCLIRRCASRRAPPPLAAAAAAARPLSSPSAAST